MDWTPPQPELFPPAACTLTEAKDEGQCPGGATSRTRKRTRRGHGWQFRFRVSQGRACPLRTPCLSPDTTEGRSVNKRDDEAQYQAAQQRAQTAEYPAVRREPPRIERKLAERVRWQAGRRARSRGRLRVKIQYVRTARVVKCKRIVKRLSLSLPPHFT